MLRTTISIIFGIVLVGCSGGDAKEECAEPEIMTFADADGDGYGDATQGEETCGTPAGRATTDTDCDDTNELSYPNATEICDLLDNNCDGVADENIATTQYFLDSDGDGFGTADSVVEECMVPEGYALTGDDCDDDDANNFPGNVEICDTFDNNCDGEIDDRDPLIDPASQSTWYADQDGDTYGNPDMSTLACEPRNGAVDNPDDCNDNAAVINPAAIEICNSEDDNCDGLIDEDDPTIDPLLLSPFWDDLDGDGYGDWPTSSDHCFQPPDTATNGDDCDDNDPTLGPPADWYPDVDLDGFGGGLPAEYATCTPLDPTLISDFLGVDCNDADPTINPGEAEICEDGIDNDCDGLDAACVMPSCQEYLAYDPSATSGVYVLEPDVGSGLFYDVYCDMVEDNGGWTLVGSSAGTTMSDEANAYYADLAIADPAIANPGVWNGMRDWIQGNSDIRFTCKANANDANMRVDLSFYDIHWYREITTGADLDSCFNESNGLGYDQPAPARRDNVAGLDLPLGDDWNVGYLEGEDSCGDTSDFTVDFDDRGMDSNQSDGTDWGRDDNTGKCGTSPGGASWFIWVR